MKNRSVRFRITFWYACALILLIGLTFLTIHAASALVLRSTIRDYLIGVVEVNADKIQYVEKKDTVAGAPYIYVACGDGFLKIGNDFMNTVSDVNSAIYTQNGEMLYGENPLAVETEAIPFTESQIWRLRHGDLYYNVYDRLLNLGIEDADGKTLWLRGMVSEEDNIARLGQITGLSLLVLPFLILAAVLLGYLLAGRLTSPIRDLEQTAERISGGNDLQQRIETGESRDEFARLAEVFNGMMERLEGSFKAERRFTSDASHELRTPMAVIRAQTEYILEKDRTAEEYKEAFRVIERQGERMNTLINDMLDYTRMDQSAERYPMTETDLSYVVQETADQLALLKTKDITLSQDIAPDIIVNGNALLLGRLVQNLISNAYRYGNEGGHIWVSLSRNEDDGTAALTVQDDGIGIALEEQEKIFERFYRSDASRTAQGTGLGLSMVKKIAELHDAQLHLDSAPGRGSGFIVIFKTI
ncbi:MAG: HAMP domain-containing histidine kinase [Lachnospiraceae bacterium]|nr:HAMP domain-containing histidine kinase [Lachnospiraceae bacterium]